MKREFLTELGLEKDIIDKIMAENGKDIAAEKAKTTAAEASLTEMQATLDEANATIAGFKEKDLDVDKAQNLAKDWEKKFRAAEAARPHILRVRADHSPRCEQPALRCVYERFPDTSALLRPVRAAQG